MVAAHSLAPPIDVERARARGIDVDRLRAMGIDETRIAAMCDESLTPEARLRAMGIGEPIALSGSAADVIARLDTDEPCAPSV